MTTSAEKKATLNLRVNSQVKQNAEEVLAQLGISMSTAVDMYLRQIAMTNSIPFSLQVKNTPDSVNTAMMSADEIRAKMDKGYEEALAGQVRSVKSIPRKSKAT